MLKRVVSNRKVLIGGILAELSVDSEKLDEYKRARGLYLEDKWERVKIIFSRDINGELHPELVNTIQMIQTGFFVGAFIGGTSSSMKGVHDFLNNNDATLFFTKIDAYKKLFNKSVVSFGKGAFKMAPRFSIFIGGFYLFSACFEAYRNQTGIIEYTVGGTGIGALCRLSFGIRGLISGGLVGGILGTIFGTLKYSVEKLFKVEGTELKYAHFALKKYRDGLIARATKLNKDELTIPEAAHITFHHKNPLDSVNLGDTEEEKKSDSPVQKKPDET